MRKIKFRAWHKKKKKMDGIWRLQFVTDNLICAYLPLSEHKPQEIGKDVVLMQYTGLKDKNGKEIYEGDIIRDPQENWHDDMPRLHSHQGIIKWLIREWWIKYNNYNDGRDLSACSEMEVIGNIYENPELVQKKGK